ncbi:MAG: Arc family DNA-binding protein [Methylorubrum populi]
MYPSQVADRFSVRMPDGMRDRIAAAAKANRRSMNSEIVHHLAQAFGEGETPTTGQSCQATPAVGSSDPACQGGSEIHG